MRTRVLLPIPILCVALVSCGRDDPAKAVRIVKRPAVAAKAAVRKARAPVAAPTVTYTQTVEPPKGALDFCPPPPEDAAGPSRFAASGPCEFRHEGAVSCESIQDDFIVAMTRKAKNGGTIVIYLNVEFYHGPGTYDGAQLFVAAQGGTNILRWSNDEVRATVGPQEAYVVLPEAKLELEPLLMGCDALIGPGTNHQYQCRDRGDIMFPVDGAEVISGMLRCANLRKSTE